MPKRKRMSFTNSRKKRQSLTPMKQGVASIQTQPRGRSKAKRTAPSQSRDEPSAVNEDEGDNLENGEVDDDDEEMDDSVTPSRLDILTENDEEGNEGDEGAEEEDDDESLLQANSIPRLTAETVYVRKETITKRWEHMDSASQRAVRQIFVDVARPVIASQLGDKVGRSAEDSEGRSAEAQQAVEKVVLSLSRQLHKMPMPPKTSSDAFDYEKMVRDTSAAEAQLSEHMAGIATLRAELRRSDAERKKAEQEGLEFEKQVESHEADLKKRLYGKFGRLLRNPDREPEDSARRIRLLPRRKGKDPLASDAGVNDEVKKLMNQLSQHIASIQTNRAQTSHMEVELAHTKATVDEFLHNNGDSGHLEVG